MSPTVSAVPFVSVPSTRAFQRLPSEYSVVTTAVPVSAPCSISAERTVRVSPHSPIPVAVSVREESKKKEMTAPSPHTIST